MKYTIEKVTTNISRQHTKSKRFKLPQKLQLLLIRYGIILKCSVISIVLTVAFMYNLGANSLVTHEDLSTVF